MGWDRDERRIEISLPGNLHMFKNEFREAMSSIAIDEPLINEVYHDLDQRYSEPHRAYHTMQHLDHVVAELLLVKGKISSWLTTLLSVAFHDVIYDPMRNDNEEKSAEYACKVLEGLAIDRVIIEQCKEQIMATKSHEPANNSDGNFFIDADMAVLGSNPEQYLLYASAIRIEYQGYPDEIYNPGRVQVLKKFLDMKQIFITDHFRNKYEESARNNISGEISKLISNI